MQILKNEELLVDSEMIISFMVDYLSNELKVFYVDEETEEEMEFVADCYNWQSDDPEPQLGRIDIHACGGEMSINLIGNYWTCNSKKLEHDIAENEKEI